MGLKLATFWTWKLVSNQQRDSLACMKCQLFLVPISVDDDEEEAGPTGDCDDEDDDDEDEGSEGAEDVGLSYLMKDEIQVLTNSSAVVQIVTILLHFLVPRVAP